MSVEDAGVAGRRPSFTPANVTRRLACPLRALDTGEWRASLPASEGPRVRHGPCTPTRGWGRQVEGDRGAWPCCLPLGSAPPEVAQVFRDRLSIVSPVTTHKRPSSLRTLSSVELHPILTASRGLLTCVLSGGLSSLPPTPVSQGALWTGSFHALPSPTAPVMPKPAEATPRQRH